MNSTAPLHPPAIFARHEPLRQAVRRNLLIVGLLGAGVWQPSLHAAEATQVETANYAIPAGDLGEVLSRFAEQAGVSLTLSPDQVRGKRSVGLRGNWTTREGFRQLLEGSSLQAVPSGDGVFVLRPLGESSAMQLGGNTVTGMAEQDASGPLDGYLAKRSAAGTKTDTPLIRTPQAISVVTRDQMDDQAVTNVAQALRYTSGVFTEYRGSSHRVDEVFARGFGYLPTYLDGLSFGGESYSQIDPWMLERVELIHGPASVLYGQATPGGLLNMVSKRPSLAAKNAVQLGAGSDSLVNGAIDLNGQLDEQGDWLYRFNGVASKGQNEVDHVEEERQAFAPALTWSPDEDTRLTLLGYYQNDPEAGYRNFWPTAGVANSGPYGRLSRHLDVGDPDWYKSTREQTSLGYLFEHRFNDALTFRQNARLLKENGHYRQMVFQFMSNAYTLERQPADNTEDMRQFVIDNQLQFDLQTGALAHTLLAGADYKRTHLDTWGARDLSYSGEYPLDIRNPVYGITLGSLTVNTDQSQKAEQLGIYLQDQIELGGWNLMIGGRQDRSEVVTDNHLSGSRVTVDDDKFTGRAGLLYAFDNGISPYLSYSTSFEPVLSSGAPGSSPFKPTSGKQTELGLKYQPPGSEALFSAALFDLAQRNVVTYDSVNGYNTQTGEIKTHGLELEARGRVLSNWELIGSYTFLQPKVSKSEQTGIEGNQPARQPNHLASAWATYRFDAAPLAGLSIGGGARYVGSSYGNAANTYKVPSILLLDAMLGYELKYLAPELAGASLQINASNLADKQYAASCAAVDTCFYGSSRTLTASVNYAW
ncbi:TonB-dependent siderophore receptor [Pseudomonas kuykendallii]|uniref:Metal-pseudopaline receptor CntO n=1 Tax=Pseudomonas kuykendallii TaxID=1007099 RepID=A0A1H2RLE3_9PSED|nr:TonB-dependent siderophore receptor [Pseudomonas kuykendallii]MCQ4273081.1 TonB-dependent siderophore receptor [Pseudomonas kuykendallii]SDW20187.1 iron complex outermembrane recepter protein [Pseudomonas kuykendallii]